MLPVLIGAAVLAGCAQPGSVSPAGSAGAPPVRSTVTPGSGATDVPPSDVYYSSVLPTTRVELPRGAERPEGAPATPDANLTREQIAALLMSQASSPSTDNSCTAADLRLSLDSPDGAAGHHFARLLAANISGRTCAVQGWPGMGIRGGWGTAFTTVVGHNPPDPNPIGVPPADPAIPVTVPAGGHAAATLEWTGSLGGAYDELASLFVVQLADGQYPVILELTEADSVDIGPETTVRIGPWGQAAGA